MRGYRRVVKAQPIRQAFHTTLQVRVEVLEEGSGEARVMRWHKGSKQIFFAKSCDLR